MKGIHEVGQRLLLSAVSTGAVALMVFGALSATAGATTRHNGRHHYRHHRLRHAGFSKPAPATITISDVSPNPVVDNFGPVSVTVTRTGSTKKAANLSLFTTDGTAVAGTDYTGGPYAVTIPKGQTSTNISLPITDDETADENESFYVSLGNAPRGTVIVGSYQTVTIINDDQPGSFSVPGGDTITLSGTLNGCDGLTEVLANPSDHSALTTGNSNSGCDAAPFTDSWANTGSDPVSVAVQLIDTTCANATYESDDFDQDIFDNGGDWFSGDHNAIWTDLGGTTHISMTDAASCTYPANREPGTGDNGNLLATVSIAPTPN